MTLSASGKLSRRTPSEPVVISQSREIIVDGPGDSGHGTRLDEEVYQIRDVTEAPQSKVFRRMLWVWFRVYVRNGNEKVNVRIPLPVPLLGALLPRQLYLDRALILREIMQRSANPAKDMKEYMESTMAVEFVRVEDGDELVIVGLD